ncbi:septum site-determining protein MinC [Butyrivibrio sp. VCB2006]|uniref:septum site-determining protein MinC n=1 Tax=Butyrivibrio sp. VCB2006 TaxID=1280679 RepID=UPI0003FD1FF4|nr:septum site-determining protein MinC [Butyrivibrio sp. VCB2006]
MNQSVTIKGTKSGIILVLDPSVPFTQLRDGIKENFLEAASFLGKNNMGLIIRGRKLSESEEKEVISIIEANTKLSITCAIDEESETERLFKEPVRHEEKPIPEQSEIITQNVPADVCDNNAQILVGNLRSGQDVSCEQNVVILGDVKPGASVTSYGSIFILGELRGNAFAGAGGDQNAIVMALKLNPLQVRIADAIAISPDAEKGPKLKLKKKKIMASENEPEVAYIENGHIVKTMYGPSFLRQFGK